LSKRTLTTYEKMPTPEQIRNAQDSYKSQEQKAKSEQHVKENVYTADGVIEQQLPLVLWTVSGLIIQGLTVIAGQAKIGKSWLLLQMAICIASGTKFLGRYRCQQQDVLYVALEDNKRRIRDRLLRIGKSSAHLYFDTSNFITPETLPHVLNAMPNVKTVIIDTLGRYLERETADSNSYHEMTKVMGALHTLAKERGISIIVCTHTRKNSGQNTDFADDVIGSKATIGAADTVLKLSRLRFQNDGKLEVSGKDVEERTIPIAHGDNWLWFDTSAPSPRESDDNPDRNIEPAYSEWSPDGAEQGELEF